MTTGEEIRKFWAQTRAALSKVDMDAKVELVESEASCLLGIHIGTSAIGRTASSQRRMEGFQSTRRPNCIRVKS